MHTNIFPGGSNGKASACNAGDLGSIPGSGRSPGEGNSNINKTRPLAVTSYLMKMYIKTNKACTGSVC